MSDECCFDPQVILDDIPAAIASGALTINNASRIGMSREQFIIAASQSPMGTFASEEGCCFDIDAILADIPGAIEAGVLNQNNAHRIGLSRGGFAVILAMIQGGGGGGGDVFNPGVAYIQTNGNDSTAQIGNPARPYLTAQAAFDNGAVNFHIGAGITTTINIVATGFDDLTAHLFITGTGLTASVVSVVATAQDGNVDLRVRSNLTCQFGTVEGTSNNGGSCYTEIVAAFVTYFNSQCPSGTASGKAAFCEVSVDSSGLLPASAYMSRVGVTSYP